MALFSICKQINDPRIDRKRVHSADAIVYKIGRASCRERV